MFYTNKKKSSAEKLGMSKNGSGTLKRKKKCFKCFLINHAMEPKLVATFITYLDYFSLFLFLRMPLGFPTLIAWLITFLK